MGTKIKFKRLDLNFVKKNYPILFETIETLEQDLKDKKANLTMVKEHVAGLCLEIALKADGTTEIFEDDLPAELLGEEEDEF